MRRKGFTLLELMAVVAIVALITAVAVPNYKSYIVRSRVATALSVMEYYANLGEEYYEAHGVFGNAQDLGLNIGAQNYLVANPQSINQYTTTQRVFSDSSLGNCFNEIRFSFDPTALGISQGFDLQMVVRNKNGMFETTCGIPWDQNSSSYANVLQYFPTNCRDQNVNAC